VDEDIYSEELFGTREASAAVAAASVVVWVVIWTMAGVRIIFSGGIGASVRRE
jgi:hypothetical protein